jgi:hypothetical protein
VTFTLGHVGKANHPGEYLQARRARMTPAEVGLVPGPRRRLARLRRDELAMLPANPIARALSPGLQVGQNLSRWPFVDPAAKQVFPIGTKRPPWPSGACGKAPPTIPTIPDCAHSSANCPVPASDSSNSGNRPTWIPHGEQPPAPSRCWRSIPDPHPARRRPVSRPIHHHLARTSQQHIGARYRQATRIAAKQFSA